MQQFVVFTTLLCFMIRFGNTVVINVIPEYINGFHNAGVKECDIPCEFAESNEHADGELNIAMGDGDVLSAVNRNSQVPIRIVGSHEPQHFYHLLKLEYLKRHFQGSALLDRKSDIPWVLMYNMDEMRKVEISKDALPKATFVARNCNPMNNRNEYVQTIGNMIGLVAPGNCMNNMKWPDCNGKPCTKVEVLRGYKIHLAFENGDSPGFVTDKIYQAFEAGVLPVWMGTRDISDTVPEGSYIDVAEFNTPTDVANYLKLVLENETLYNIYFKWKQRPLDPEYVRLNEPLWTTHVFCRICHYVDTLKKGLEWDHTTQRAKIPHINSSLTKPKPIYKERIIEIIQYRNIPNSEHFTNLSIFIIMVLVFALLITLFRKRFNCLRSCFRT